MVNLIATLQAHSGEGWLQGGELALALGLGSAIGLEREIREKSAGLRTHALVALGAGLFMLVSKYGVLDVVNGKSVIVDPSRVAAQIVTGIGFIGGGLIFVRRDAVRGLTTAAAVWLTAAVGATAGAGLPLLAVGATAGHFLVVYGYTPLVRRLPGSRHLPNQLTLRYEAGSGALSLALQECAARGFQVAAVAVEREVDDGQGRAQRVEVRLTVKGTGALSELVSQLESVEGVLAVNAEDPRVQLEQL